MSENTQLAVHETMELHEIIKCSVVELKALQQYYQQAKEPKTQSLIQNCINSKQNMVQELERFSKSHSILQ
jgi:NAD-specific glutamate dehydrogenase